MTFVHRYRHCTGSLFRRMFFFSNISTLPKLCVHSIPQKISQYFQYFKKYPIFPISQYFQYPNSSNLPKLCIHSTPQQGAMPSSRTQGPRGQDSQSIHFKSHLELTLLHKWNPWRPNPPKNVNGELCHLDHSTVGLTVEEEGSQDSPNKKSP